jgi:hypothetical protein
MRRQRPEQYKDTYRQLESSLESSDKIYFTVSTQDDANIIKSAYEQHRSLVRKKLIILIHNTPTLIESNILQSVTVIGCFSSLYASYVINFDIILGRTDIKPAHYLTISLGSNGSVYDHKRSNFTFSLGSPEYKLLPFYATARERVLAEENGFLTEEIKGLKDDINKEKKNRVIIIIIMLIILCIFLYRARNKGASKTLPSRGIASDTNKPSGNIIRFIVSICIIAILVLITVLWYFSGENFLLENEKPLDISGRVFSLAYQFPIVIFSIVGLSALVVFAFINIPSAFQSIMNVFLKKNGRNKTTE